MDMSSFFVGAVVGVGITFAALALIRAAGKDSVSAERDMAAKRIESLRKALRRIVENETGRANATVRRMAYAARAALRDDDLRFSRRELDIMGARPPFMFF